MIGLDMGVQNIEDKTQYGHDVTEDGQSVRYYIQVDLFGDSKHIAIRNHDNKLRYYTTFKEALIFLAVARENAMFPATKSWIVRTFDEYGTNNLEVVEAESEEEYYD